MKKLGLVFAGLLGTMLILTTACGGEGANPTPRGTTPPPVATPTVGVTRPSATTPAPAVTPTGVDRAAALEVVRKGGCGACHTIAGIPEMAGSVGPELTHIGTVAAARKPDTSAEAYIRESIENPQAFVAPGFPPVMVEVRHLFTDAEFETLVAFLLAQK